MAAQVVYEGALGGGNLFEGIKFYLLQRIPQRNHFKGLVEANGGQVVKIEKQADIIIADHARKDAPAGSISWTYIDKSVRDGRLQEIKDHPAGPAQGEARPVGSTLPARRGKVPFTAEDDRELMAWCERAERRGASLGGNEIYKQLEARNNRHTWQSWKDRWRIYLQNRPRPAISRSKVEAKVEEGDEEEGLATPTANGRRPNPPGTRREIQEPAATSLSPSISWGTSRPASKKSPRSPSSGRPYLSTSAGGKIFTEEETQLLLDAYEDIVDLDENRIIDAWTAWAVNYPNHTAQEWRNHFTEFVAPYMVADEAQSRHGKKAPQPSSSTLKAAPSKGTSAKQILEVKDSQSSSNQRLSSSGTQAKPVDPSTQDETVFRRDLLILADSINVEVNFKPVICGQTIPLFKLWQVVQSHEFGGYNAVNGMNLWPKVAQKFNINPYRNPNATADIKSCFEEILADFAEAREEYEQEPELTESQEIENQLLETVAYAQEGEEEEEVQVAEEEHDDDLGYPQSSPAARPSSSSKRSLGVDQGDEEIAYNKRQRIDKGKGIDRGRGEEIEIPSTPEEVLNNNQIAKPRHKPSPLNYSPVHISDDSDEEGLPVKPINFHRSKAATPRYLEPETQNFTQFAEPDDEIDAEAQRPGSPIVHKSSSPMTHNTIPSRHTHRTVTPQRGSVQPSIESSTQSQTESQQAAVLETFVDEQVRQGYPLEVIAEALEATTMEIGSITEEVAESLMNGEGIPENVSGAWTANDDEALDQGMQTSEWKRVVKKHGVKRCHLRRRFLKDRREVEEEEEEQEEQEGYEADG